MSTIQSSTCTAALKWLNDYKQLLTAAKAKPNAAAYMYANNGRQIAFMLQAIGRSCKKLHNKKRFTKLGDNFKQDEDLLGQIDYYHWLLNLVQANKKISKAAKDLLKQKLQTAEATFNAELKKKYFDSDKLLTKFDKKIRTADWLAEGDEAKALAAFYKAEIAEIQDFLALSLPKLTKVEEQIHEIRRKLRWLSIYPQAFGGAIQYKSPVVAASPAVAALITSAEKKSVFNKLPSKGKRKDCLLLNKNSFLACSYVIAQLGIIKDKALALHGLSSIIMQSDKISEKEAQSLVLANIDAAIICTDEEALQQASTLLAKLVKAKALNVLVA